MVKKKKIAVEFSEKRLFGDHNNRDIGEYFQNVLEIRLCYTFPKAIVSVQCGSENHITIEGTTDSATNIEEIEEIDIVINIINQVHHSVTQTFQWVRSFLATAK